MTDVVDAPAARSEPADLPRWDLTPLYPSVGSRELAVAHEGLVADVARLQALFDRHDVRGGDPLEVGPEQVAIVDEVLPALNDLMEANRRVVAYLYGVTTTDATDAEAARLQSRLGSDLAPLGTLVKRLQAWIARLGADDLIAGSEAAEEHAFWVRRSEQAAAHLMSEAEEDLAGELTLTGGGAWRRLHGEVTALLTVDVPGRGSLPMAAVRGLATDPDAEVRRVAFEAEIAAWRTVEVPLAAGLNGFKGEANVLNRRRGWDDPLDEVLFHNNVDRATLSAMQAAVVAVLPDFARANKARARALGRPDGAGLPWWDLLAPLGDAGRIDWPEAVASVAEAFATFSPKLASLVTRAAEERWIDAEPRPGKVGGAYCMSVEAEVSRVLLNFDGSFDSVQTLAHELGHAYHNTNLADRSPLQRRTPMALAETASIFCETVMVQAGLATAPTDEARLAILATDLGGAVQVVADIHSRFLFETALYAERRNGVLSPGRMCELMTEAQRTAYLDGVDHDHLHPYLWAVKSHYYTPFYNWPYTFGLLFGIGLYAEFQRDPERFRQGYDELLAATGMGEAAALAARFGIDVRDEGFWTASLDVLRGRIDELCRLTGYEGA